MFWILYFSNSTWIYWKRVLKSKSLDFVSVGWEIDNENKRWRSKYWETIN